MLNHDLNVDINSNAVMRHSIASELDAISDMVATTHPLFQMKLTMSLHSIIQRQIQVV